jgi:uncharacterized protein
MRLMSFSAPPAMAAWQHRETRTGFEVAYFRRADDGYRIDGCTTAVENGQAWAVTYAITADSTWTTRRAQITAQSAAGPGQVLLEADGAGHWLVDGQAAPHLDGCLDIDLESSAMTNALPVHRMSLSAGGHATAPAAYVRALDLAAERLEQVYTRLTDEGSQQRFDYAAPSFNFRCELTYDDSGLVLDYPGVAARAA